METRLDYGMTRTTRPKPSLSPNTEPFGERLARLRKAKGLTQVELAGKVGMLQGVISSYESGKLRPYADVVARFAEVLEVSADDLLGLNRRAKAKEVPISEPASSKRFARRAQMILKLPKRDQDALARTIDTFLKLHLEDRSA